MGEQGGVCTVASCVGGLESAAAWGAWLGVWGTSVPADVSARAAPVGRKKSAALNRRVLRGCTVLSRQDCSFVGY